jgi:hypothetical protein
VDRKNFTFISYHVNNIYVIYFARIYIHDALYTVKGKAIPLQAWTGPGGSRRLRLPDFKTIGT